MNKQPDDMIENNPRLLHPLVAMGLSVLLFGSAFLLLVLSVTPDAVTISSRLAVLLLPVALGAIPVPIVGAFVRRRTWFVRPALRASLAAYGFGLLVIGTALLDRGFGILGMPPAPPAAASTSTSTSSP